MAKKILSALIIYYLQRNPTGLTTKHLYSLIYKVTEGGGYTLEEFNKALVELRDSRQISIVNKRIWASIVRPKRIT